MEHLIALQDISDSIKAGDHFEAPDRILVAVGMAKDAIPSMTAPEPLVLSESQTEAIRSVLHSRTRRRSSTPRQQD